MRLHCVAAPTHASHSHAMRRLSARGGVLGGLLVTGAGPGVAMNTDPMTTGGRRLHAPGAIVGKTPEPPAHGIGEILIPLSL